MFHDDDDDDVSSAPEEEGDDSADYDNGQDDPAADSADDAAGGGLPAANEVEAGRNALGELLGTLQDNGVDIDALAQQAGVDGTDIDDMEHGELVALAKHVAASHPELVQDTLGRYPVAQGLLGRYLAG